MAARGLIPMLLKNSLLAYLLLVAVTHAKEAVDLSARLDETKDGKIVLCLEIRNNLQETIIIPAARLPWKWGGAITLTLVKGAPLSEPLSLAKPIEDPPIGQIKLLPGGSLRGKLGLDYYFPELQQARRRAPLILFWNWIVDHERKGDSTQQGGWLAIGPPKDHGSD